MKYVEHVIYTIEELRERGHDVYGLIIGDGSLREEFERLCRFKKIKKFYKVPGNCRQEWIAKVLPKSTLILSFIWEGLLQKLPFQECQL